MSVQYKGPKPDKNYNTIDFRNKGIDVMILAKWKHWEENFPCIRVIFRSNGLCGEIRTCCYGDSFAVDFAWGWHTNENVCLTTECKTLREAKSILYMAFKEKGFVVPKKLTDNDWSKNHWSYAIKNL